MILLENGKIIAGSGAPSQPLSLLVDDGKIVEVGVVERSSGMEVCDCRGCIVAPGFIDVHSHSDLEVLEHRPEKVRQGVTSEVVGNCGFHSFPDSLRGRWFRALIFLSGVVLASGLMPAVTSSTCRKPAPTPMSRAWWATPVFERMFQG